MNRPIRKVVLLAAVAFLSPSAGVAEQPQRAAAGVGAPAAVGWTARAPDVSSMSWRPEVRVPTIEAAGDTPRNVSVEWRGDLEIDTEDCANAQTVVDEGAFLRPTWDRGFWAMPPGGLTRFLWPSPGFINPEETLAP